MGTQQQTAAIVDTTLWQENKTFCRGATDVQSFSVMRCTVIRSQGGAGDVREGAGGNI